MQASDIRTFWKGRLFIWSPPGYLVFGFFRQGQHYVLYSRKSNRVKSSRPTLESRGKCRYLNVHREAMMEDV